MYKWNYKYFIVQQFFLASLTAYAFYHNVDTLCVYIYASPSHVYLGNVDKTLKMLLEH